MSGAGMGTNPASFFVGFNNDRPGGATVLAASRDVDTLKFAIATGNRQTRRLAAQNLARTQRKEAR